MLATIMYSAGDVRTVDVPDPSIVDVFDRTVGLGEVPDGYRAMADRESIKVLVRP
jgi:hypothetical protein